MKRILKSIFFLGGLIIPILIGCSPEKSKDTEPNQKSKEKMPTRVDGFVVKPSTLLNEISVSGSLLAYEEVVLMNETAGRVVFINLPEGKFVKKGTLLVKLFDDDLQASLKKMQSQLAIQEKILERQADLLKVNGISQYDYDQTSLQVSSIKSEIEVQKTLIRKSEVLAPFDGVIGLRNISVGAQITPSTALATIRMENLLKLDFSVPEKYSSEIKPGLKVMFTVNGKDTTYQASVMATEGGIETNTRNLKVRAVVNSKSKDIVPGGFANVQLTLGENKNALMIPTQAIIPQERNKSVIVAKDGMAHFVVVHTGIRRSSTIEISDGLNPGDTVVTNGILLLKEGAKISFSNVKTDAL
jgi:membrane fusion protein, multidrug efflux system